LFGLGIFADSQWSEILLQNVAGADICNAARAMMFSLGCIQALKCNTNHCPTGVATQDKELMKGLDPTEKSAVSWITNKQTLYFSDFLYVCLYACLPACLSGRSFTPCAC
jgi:hypothetical protein